MCIHYEQPTYDLHQEFQYTPFSFMGMLTHYIFYLSGLLRFDCLHKNILFNLFDYTV